MNYFLGILTGIGISMIAFYIEKRRIMKNIRKTLKSLDESIKNLKK